MIVCSCRVITDADIEQALIEILSAPSAPIPTPGVVFRHLSSQMNCCGCAPLAVETIYSKMSELIASGRICPHRGKELCGKLLRMTPKKRSDGVLPGYAQKDHLPMAG